MNIHSNVVVVSCIYLDETALGVDDCVEQVEVDEVLADGRHRLDGRPALLHEREQVLQQFAAVGLAAHVALSL